MEELTQIHLGCGDIYLEKYVNYDVCGKFVNEVSEEELEQNKTTLTKYFKYPFGSPRREVIYDKKMNLLEFPWDIKDNSIDKTVMISCFEHFTEKEALCVVNEKNIKNWRPNNYRCTRFKRNYKTIL